MVPATQTPTDFQRSTASSVHLCPPTLPHQPHGQSTYCRPISPTVNLVSYQSFKVARYIWFIASCHISQNAKFCSRAKFNLQSLPSAAACPLCLPSGCNPGKHALSPSCSAVWVVGGHLSACPISYAVAGGDLVTKNANDPRQNQSRQSYMVFTKS